jgi:small subunit ribosomal protein S6
MAVPAPTYDLTLMLDTSVEEDERAKALAEAERIIGAGGTIVNRQEWGVRATAYEIRHKTDAEYHLLQFEGGREVLETLDRTLRITDGIVRFRIIKLPPGATTPEAPAAVGAAPPPASADDA